MSLSDDCAIMRQVQAEARRRYLRRIDKMLSARTDELGDLYRRGLEAQAKHDRERQQHRLSISHGRASADHYGWHVRCACGWTSRTSTLRRFAEQDLALERDYLNRALYTGPVEHYVDPAAKVVA